MRDRLSRVRVLREAGGARPIAEALAAWGWSAAPEVLKEDGRASVLLGTLAGRRVVMKIRTLRPRDRLYALAHRARGQRHWAGACRLVALGVPTAGPLLLAHARAGRRQVECLVMEALPGPSVLQHLADGSASPRADRQLAEALGRLTARLAAAGWYNRDHKPSNLIVTRADEEGAAVAVIDCVAIRRIPRWPGHYAARMLASLVIEPVGVGLLPRRVLMARVVRAHVDGVLAARGVRLTARQRRAARRAAWRIVERILERHGDPTPRTNPLAPVSG